jgi:hypothetical protein
VNAAGVEVYEPVTRYLERLRLAEYAAGVWTLRAVSETTSCHRGSSASRPSMIRKALREYLKPPDRLRSVPPRPPTGRFHEQPNQCLELGPMVLQTVPISPSASVG